MSPISSAVEPRAAVPIELLEGDVDRAWKMHLGVLGRRQHVDELRVVLEESLELWQFESLRHRRFSW